MKTRRLTLRGPHGGDAPRLARHRDDPSAVVALRMALRYLVMFQAMLIAPLVVWAEPIVSLLLGPKYAGSAAVLRGLTPYVFLLALGPLITTSVNYLGKAGRRIPIVFGALAINVAIDVTLLRDWGIVASVTGYVSGVMSAALKKDALDAAGYERLVETTTRLNTPGIALAEMAGVHAITDVTGFGLAGHALEMARGAGLGITIDWSSVPLLDGVAEMARDGFVTGASGRNWAGCGAEVELDPALPPIARDLLSDPQTSGGLLVSCDPSAAADVLAVFRAQGFEAAAVIGSVRSGPAGLRVVA